MAVFIRRAGSIIGTWLGWPDAVRDGEAAQRNAWLIVQHAISLPELQRKVLALLKSNPSYCTPLELAMLEDRTLVFSGKKQKFGTQFDWDANGELNPYPIEDEEKVDSQRAEVGLPPLGDTVRQHRARAEAEGETSPRDYKAFVQSQEEWMICMGWIRSRSEIDLAYRAFRGHE